jgi:hypothetical protein
MMDFNGSSFLHFLNAKSGFKNLMRQFQKIKTGVALVPAFAGINSSGGPEVIEKTGFPLPRE